ncbi:MAG: GGDEF domain-containing protein, partial [Sedimenticolaceae bacterium]
QTAEPEFAAAPRTPGRNREPRRRAGERRALRQSILFLPETEVTPEQGQAITRIILAALGAILFFGARQYGHGDNPFLLSVAYLLASVFYLSFISRHKDDYQWRRYVVILLDLGVASFLTGYFGQAGIAFYPLFLWVMVGNGLRYGEHFMQVATLFGLLGFSTALASSGFLWQQPAAYIGLMSGLVLMPKFFLVMIDRLAEANTELKAQKDHAEYMATHDVLTGLPNRACLHARMDQTLARARRTGNDVAVAFIDLDSFFRGIISASRCRRRAFWSWPSAAAIWRTGPPEQADWTDPVLARHCFPGSTIRAVQPVATVNRPFPVVRSMRTSSTQ